MNDPELELVVAELESLGERITAVEKTLGCLILMLSDSKPLDFESADDLIHLLADRVPAVRNGLLRQLHRFKPK